VGIVGIERGEVSLSALLVVLVRAPSVQRFALRLKDLLGPVTRVKKKKKFGVEHRVQGLRLNI